MARVRFDVTSIKLSLCHEGGLKELAHLLLITDDIQEGKPKSPADMIERIRERALKAGWREEDPIDRLTATLRWISGSKDFDTYVGGLRETGELVQFWSGTLKGLCAGQRAYDRMMGSCRVISVEPWDDILGEISKI